MTKNITQKRISIIIIVSAIIATLSLVTGLTNQAFAQESSNVQPMNQTGMMSMLERGSIAMGFNQSKILHQFKSFLQEGKSR